MDDRNRMGGDVEAQQAAVSARRKRMNEGGGSVALETTDYQGVDDNFKGSHSTTTYVSASSHHGVEESHIRSIVKGVTWRCLATLTTVVIAWFITGEVALAFQIGFVEFFAKLGIYYAHERVWTKIRI